MKLSTNPPCKPSIVPNAVALNELSSRSLEINGLEVGYNGIQLIHFEPELKAETLSDERRVVSRLG